VASLAWISFAKIAFLGSPGACPAPIFIPGGGQPGLGLSPMKLEPA